MGVGLRLKEILKEKGISVPELAKRTGISVNTLRGTIRRDGDLKFGNLIKIADAIGIGAFDLIDENLKDFHDRKIAVFSEDDCCITIYDDIYDYKKSLVSKELQSSKLFDDEQIEIISKIFLLDDSDLERLDERIDTMLEAEKYKTIPEPVEDHPPITDTVDGSPAENEKGAAAATPISQND